MKRLTLKITMTVAMLLALLPAACSLPQSKARPVYYYTIDYSPAPVQQDRQFDGVIRVNRFTASPPFNSQRIFYGDKGLHRNAYASFKWVAEPGELLAYTLTRDLQQSALFKAVVAPSSATSPTHEVHGWVEEFIEEDYDTPAQASVRASIILIDARQPDPVDRILLQKRYQAKAPCNRKTPDALSRAMSQAVREMFSQVTMDIYSRLAGDGLTGTPRRAQPGIQ